MWALAHNVILHKSWIKVRHCSDFHVRCHRASQGEIWELYQHGLGHQHQSNGWWTGHVAPVWDPESHSHPASPLCSQVPPGKSIHRSTPSTQEEIPGELFRNWIKQKENEMAEMSYLITSKSHKQIFKYTSNFFFKTFISFYKEPPHREDSHMKEISIKGCFFFFLTKTKSWSRNTCLWGPSHEPCVGVHTWVREWICVWLHMWG